MNPILQQAVAALQSGHTDDAERLFAQAMSLSPTDPQTHHYLALFRYQQRRFPEALASMDEALSLAPGYAEAWGARAALLQAAGRLDEALISLDRALVLAPNDPRSHHCRGLVLRGLGRPLEALRALDRTVAIAPLNAQAWNDRGVSLYWDFMRPLEAVESYDRALAIAPRQAFVLANRGVALWAADRTEKARASFDAALAIDPEMTTALYNRGRMVWAGRREYAPAIADLEAVLRLDPDYTLARGELLHMKCYGADWDGFDGQLALIDQGVRAGRQMAAPFVYQALSSSPADLLACSRIFSSARHRATPPVRAHLPRERRPGRIRVGYLCADFREQATSALSVGLYEAHDRDRFEVIAFDNGGSDGSPLRARLEAGFDRMIDIRGLGDPEAAQRVAAEDIDILVNLNGYYGGLRMDVFARRAAPIQVNFLGFPGTLGADYMDYILADRCVLPEDEQRFFVEQVAYLPESYQVNDDKRGVPVRPAGRAEHGLPEDGVVFCHFNHAYKLTPETFAGWMRIVAATPGSVLWLLEGRGPFRDNLRRAAQAQGVAQNRLVFAPVIDHDDHLARLPLGDLFLDSLPYNAHTTGSDALWMGLPLLTCRGTAFAGRVAASLLEAVGLPELITHDRAAYEALAIALARDPARLASLRQRLVERRATAPLFDTVRFARHLEDAYEMMMRTWQAGDAPKGFSVAARP